MSNSQSVMVVYADYARAFDVVCHNKLLSKLSVYGIVGDLIDWIRVSLNNRLQCTGINEP